MQPDAEEQHNILNEPLKEPPTIDTMIATLNAERSKPLEAWIRAQALLDEDLRDPSTKPAVVATSFDDVEKEFNMRNKDQQAQSVVQKARTAQYRELFNQIQQTVKAELISPY